MELRIVGVDPKGRLSRERQAESSLGQRRAITPVAING